MNNSIALFLTLEVCFPDQKDWKAKKDKVNSELQRALAMYLIKRLVHEMLRLIA